MTRRFDARLRRITVNTFPMKRLALLLALGSLLPAAAITAATETPVHQLRIYELFEHNKAAFHARFRDHAMRIMARYDFRIVDLWETKHGDRTEFVYLLEWPDVATMKDRWAKFMADPEWSAVKKQTAGIHGTLVGRIEERVLQRTAYSAPARAP